MSRHRLQQALQNFNPAEIDAIFGENLFSHDALHTGEFANIQRVAIFTEAFLPKVDGVTKSAYLTMRYLQKTGREVLIFAPEMAPARIGDTRVVRMPAFSLPVAPETQVSVPTPFIRREINQFRPDLIHLFSPGWMAMSGIDAAHRINIPVIANYQTDIPGYLEKHYGFGALSPVAVRWLRYQHNRCYMTLVGSNSTMKELHHAGFKRLRLWRRGVDVECYNPEHRSELWRLRLQNGMEQDEVLRCLYVGRLAPEKRVDLLLEVARLPNVALTIVGDGALRDELEAKFAGTHTHFTGYLYGDALSQAYASADVFLFPGPNETFGQVVQEAMASGLPCVIVNRGGIVDLVQHNVNGFHCPPEPASFARAVQRLYNEPSLRKKMANASRDIATSHPWEVIMRQLEDYYIEAVALNHRLSKLKGQKAGFLPLVGNW
jgi:phosphatidylinositol alpha 1,6-mannosyltransferase